MRERNSEIGDVRFRGPGPRSDFSLRSTGKEIDCTLAYLNGGESPP